MDTNEQNTIVPVSDNTSQITKQLVNNSEKSTRGFASHPENINKAGRPGREWTWKGELEKAAQDELKDGLPVKHFVAKSLIREALKGNVHAIEVMMDRMDGKADQKLQHEGNLTLAFHNSLKQDDEHGT